MRECTTITQITIQLVEENPCFTILNFFLDKCPTEKGEYSDCDVVEDELNVYLKKKIKDTYIVLDFWKTADDVPLLKQFAKQILSIPASSATSERVFSTSGRILEERRSRLLSKNVDKILFLHKNM